MKATRKALVSLVLLLSSIGLGAQNLTDLRVSEAMAPDSTGLADSYGERNGWFEIFNTSNGTVKFGGCFLSDDKSDLKKYHIPTTDKATVLGPRQSIVFYASGKSYQGSFHTNFTIGNGSTIYLISNDGRTIIDSLTLPADLPAGKSIAKVPVGVKKLDMETSVNDYPSPGTYNGDVDAKTNSQIMKETDPHGWVLTLISVCVVFCALFILSIIFGWVGKISQKTLDKANGTVPEKKKAAKKQTPAKPGDMTPEIAAAISMALNQEFSGEVYAAIAMALDDYLGEGVHDQESFVITIKPSQNTAWSSKDQTFRQLPR